MFIIENDELGLTPYTHNDDYDMYMCWQDIHTQKGYNIVFEQTFDEFKTIEINRFKFWVTVVDKNSNKKVGTLRLGLDEKCPDLAIWIYPKYRNKGYATNAFKLAIDYIFQNFNYKEISAGCYYDNIYSLKMLEKVGFVRYPVGDTKEIDCFTGNETVQLEFRILNSKFGLKNT
ncbi:MAG: GNAT family N-acetyltransferase [Ruminococcaceae bacterium]|nr:GNAT family N-acetyltransferase [Oscillospiraceae bacterium]